MTHDLNQLAYMNGAPVEREYFFPYDNCYFGGGTRLEIECLHEWKQKQIEKFETFRRKVFGLEIPEGANTESREIRCIIPAHLLFFMQQREVMKELMRLSGIHCETSSGSRNERDGSKWAIEDIRVAGHFHLWVKLKK